MTDALDSAVPAGWYPDPWGASSQRWWDGTAWSGKLDSQSPSTAPDAAVPAPASPTVTAAPDEDYVPVAFRSTYEPASSYRTAAPPTVGSPYPSRRALRELANSAPAENDAGAAEDTSMAEPVAGIPIAEPASEAELEPVTRPAEKETPAATTVSFTASPAADDDNWAASLSGWDDVEAASAPPDAHPIFGDAPPVSYSQRTTRYQPLHGRTSPVWLIVFMPVVQALAVVGSSYLFPVLTHAAQLSTLTTTAEALAFLLGIRDWLLYAVLPLSIVFFVFTLVLGFQDRSRLRLLGHNQTASPWWIVLGPIVYLIVRTVRVRQCTGRRGSGPLTTYACLYIAPPIALAIAVAVTSALSGAIPA